MPPVQLLAGPMLARMLRALAWGALGALIAGPGMAAEQILQVAGLPVAVWQPAVAAGPLPVIVYSHGLHGCATQSSFLAEAFANAGYVVVAPNHRDATCALGRGSAPTRPAAHARERADDIRHVIKALAADPRWQGRIDWQQLGLVGYSLGGDAVLDLAGAWPEGALPGVKAVLALAPYSRTLLAQGALRRLRAPVMYQGGARDDGTTPWLSKPGGSYDQSPMPKHYVEIDGVDHSAWTDAATHAHDVVVAYGLAFMDHYVKGAPAAGLLTQALPGVAALRFRVGTQYGRLP